VTISSEKKLKASLEQAHMTKTKMLLLSKLEEWQWKYLSLTTKKQEVAGVAEVLCVKSVSTAGRTENFDTVWGV
jgi:hypothetical protein